MRRALTAIVLLALLTLSALSLVRCEGGEPALRQADASGASRTESTTASDAEFAGPTARAAPPVEWRQPVDLAAEVTACLQVLDAETAAPIAGAAIHRLHLGPAEAAIGYTDDQGLSPLPLPRPGQLVVARAGYLLRLSPTQLGTSEARPQRVLLVPDRFSSRCVVHFRLFDGSVPGEVRVRFRPDQDDPARDGEVPAQVRGASELVRRAWSEHATIAGVQAVAGLNLQAGRHNADAVHLLGDGDEVWFLGSGTYRYEAAVESGAAARGSFELAAAAENGLSIELAPGRQLAGAIIDEASRAPIAGARVAAVAGDPLRLTATTDAAGRFRLWPLAAGVVDLEVVHRDYEVSMLEAFPVGGDLVTIPLRALPAGAVRGRVRAAGGGPPIEGAVISVQDAQGQPVTARSDREGFFALRSAGSVPAQLTIGAEGYLPHAELVESGSAALEFELWPVATDARVAAGLTGLLQGVVNDAIGRPAQGVGVSFVPDHVAPPAFGGRRILQGGTAALPSVVTTAVDGSFTLETMHGGGGMLVIAGGKARGQGTRAEAVLGRKVSGLRVEMRKDDE